MTALLIGAALALAILAGLLYPWLVKPRVDRPHAWTAVRVPGRRVLVVGVGDQAPDPSTAAAQRHMNDLLAAPRTSNYASFRLDMFERPGWLSQPPGALDGE